MDVVNAALAAQARIVVIDRSARARAATIRVLATDARLSVVGEAAAAFGALAVIRSLRPSVIVVDLSVFRDGTSPTLNDVRTASGGAPVVAIGVDDHASFARAALRAGVSAYCPKLAPPAVLVAAVTRVADHA
jgi:DNA-binding NarL/FixJ family response regulator